MWVSIDWNSRCVEGLVEVAALQAVGQALIGRVVVQQHAQQGLLGLQVVRRDGDDDVALGTAGGGLELERGTSA
jgi:hypothetical protein